MPRLPRLTPVRTAVTAAAAFLVLQLARLVFLCRLPDEKLLPFIPDDAFYYLTLGRNFAELHRWTFDRIAPATGFHLLWGYGLAALATVFPHLGFRSIFVLLYLLAVVLIAASLYLVDRLVADRFGSLAVLGLFAIFLSPLSLQIPNFLMEAPLVLLCAAGVLYTAAMGPPTRKRLLCAAALGFLGMVARSDFGMLPLLLTAAAYLLRAPMRRTAAAALLGSILGLSGIVVHTLAVSGNLYQGSTRAKRQWSAMNHDSVRFALNFAALPLHTHPDASIYRHRDRNDLIRLAALSGLGLLCAGTRRKPNNVALLATASLLPFAFILLYRYDSAALQPWYYGNFLIPYGLCAAAILSVRLLPWRIATTVVAIVWSVNGVIRSLQPVWPGQTGFYKAALFLRAHPQLQNIGAWNAGILQYFSGASVVDVDGLVNDDADDFILHNHLVQYLHQRNISLLLDESHMISDPKIRERGGYSGGQLTNCIRSIDPIWNQQPWTHLGDSMVLITVDQTCLR